MIIKHSVKFIVHKRTPSATEGKVRMRLRVDGESTDISTNLSVSIDNWNDKTYVSKGQDNTDVKLNLLISEWKTAIAEIIMRYEFIEKRVPSITEVRNDFLFKVGLSKEGINGNGEELSSVYNRFISLESKKNNWTDNTLLVFRSLQGSFYAFNNKIHINDITDDLMQAYLDYLNKNGYKNSTIGKYISLVRWFLRWASANGYYNGKSHITFKPRLKGNDGHAKEIIYLSQEELQLLINTKFEHYQKQMEMVRDVFVFCCFTGLRYSDVSKLKRSDIKGGYIRVVTQKTSEGLNIELNNYSQAILDKYKDCKFKNDLALPMLSISVTNDYLKIIGKKCKLNEPTRIVFFKGQERCEEVHPKYELLTTHCARRTFVVMALRLGIPAEVIMKWTGHSSFEAMKPYVKIVDELKAQSMKRFNTLSI